MERRTEKRIDIVSAPFFDAEPNDDFLLRTRCRSDLSAALLVSGTVGYERQVRYFGIFLRSVSLIRVSGLGSRPVEVASSRNRLVNELLYDSGSSFFNVSLRS